MQFSYLRSIASRRERAIGSIVLILLLLLINLSGSNAYPQKSYSKMGVTHVVFFQFKPSTTSKDINDLSQGFLALKEKCVRPNGKPYIISTAGGIDNSIEGLQDGITHAFVLEFASVKDRDYYVNEDPEHDKFKKLAFGYLEKAQVIDFTNGVFES